MSKQDSLSRYRGRRDFRRTGEPQGRARGNPEAARASERPMFVIQQHDARTEHWDFRLEVGGVLKSWAVPKGPSTNPVDKRLAVQTEDHPLDYAEFEGVIPEGQYGAGAVIVWDAGTFENRSRGDDGEPISMEDALERGRVEVFLEGRKLRGGYALIHAKLRGDEANWLLIKLKDEGADARRKPTSTQTRSVVSGRTVAEVAEAGR